MENVSPEFKAAVYAPARATSARVTFDISDVTAAGDATETVTGEAQISRKAQLTDNVRDRPAYATFEENYWALDGSFVLPPKPEEDGFEVGWYSDAFSGADGTFTPAQVLDFTFTQPHSSAGLTVTFDVPANEYATDFTIDVYNQDGGLIHSFPVKGNTESRYVIDREQLTDYWRVTVTITKWSKPGRRAKVIEMSFGVVREYSDNELIKAALVEQIDPTSGTVAANELTFTVDNSNREFNILNPNGFYKFLQERQVANLQIGVEVSPDIYEYVDMGLYYLTDWKSDEGSLTTTFTARNRIDFIPNVEVENLNAVPTNLHDLAVIALTAIGLTDYVLDPVLQTILTKGIYPSMTYRTLLQYIAVAGQCCMFVDRKDRLNIVRLATGESVDYIDFDNLYTEPQINLGQLVSRVEVNYYVDAETVAGTQVVTSQAAGGATLRVENTLINDQSLALAVAQWIMAESNNRVQYETNWRQNPALECGDLVTIEDVYGVNKQSRITGQDFEYAGYLSGKTKSRGAV